MYISYVLQRKFGKNAWHAWNVFEMRDCRECPHLQAFSCIFECISSRVVFYK